MKVGTLDEKNHADSKYDSQFALKAIPDYEPLTSKKTSFVVYCIGAHGPSSCLGPKADHILCTAGIMCAGFNYVSTCNFYLDTVV